MGITVGAGLIGLPRGAAERDSLDESKGLSMTGAQKKKNYIIINFLGAQNDFWT